LTVLQMEPGVEAAEFGKIVDRRIVFVPVLRQGGRSMPCSGSEVWCAHETKQVRGRW